MDSSAVDLNHRNARPHPPYDYPAFSLIVYQKCFERGVNHIRWGAIFGENARQFVFLQLQISADRVLVIEYTAFTITIDNSAHG